MSTKNRVALTIPKDPGAVVFAERKQCYALIHQVIASIEQLKLNEGNSILNAPHDPSLAEKLQREAQSIIDSSDDEVFLTDLYDWYLSNDESGKLLDMSSDFLPKYLKRKANEDIAIADLLWTHYTRKTLPYEAAQVQLDLATSDFNLSLDQRIAYLGRARANASTASAGPGRANRQKLLRQITDNLDVANIQSDVLQHLKSDPRLAQLSNPGEIINRVSGQLLDMTTLFNEYCDNAGYYDISLLIFQAAGHRVPTDIKNTWKNLLAATHTKATEGEEGTQPYEAVIDVVRNLGKRLKLSEATFPVPELLPMLERYSFEYQRGVGATTWVVDLFIDLGVPFEAVFTVLQSMLYNDEPPFQGPNRKWIADDILYVCQRWFREARSGRLFGSDATANEVLSTLQVAINNGLSRELVGECQTLRANIDRLLP
jgi:nuclear pore complex protein Nup155